MNTRNACLGVLELARGNRNGRVVEKCDFRLPEIKRLIGLGWTDAEIGARLGITRQRVYQIRDAAAIRSERDESERISDGHEKIAWVPGKGLCQIDKYGVRTLLEATAE